MSWSYPFVTVDQNQLRHPERVARVLDICCRNGLHALLPDGAFLEFGKTGYFLDTTRLSLKLLAPYRELICAGRKIQHLMADELQTRAPAATLVNEGTTKFLRSMLEELERSEETALRRLAEGPVADLMPPALELWNDHDRNKRLVQGLHDALKTSMPSNQLMALRRSPEEEIGRWLSSQNGTAFVFQGLTKRGLDNAAAYELTRIPSVSATFLSTLAALAVYWIAIGGIDSVTATQSSGDLHDVEYIILGALSHSLATEDRRAGLICKAVADAIQTRQRLPSPQARV